MNADELANFLTGVSGQNLQVVVRDASGNLVEAYYEYLTAEDAGGPAILIKQKYPPL